MLLRDIKNIYHKELDEIYAKEEVDSFFGMLIAHFLKLERFVLAMQPNLVLTKVEEQPLFDALSQLRSYRPIQYIIGTAHFMDMDFIVDENVLIPRPETEDLVRWILEDLDANQSDASHDKATPRAKTPPHDKPTLQDKPTLLDVGTGSGCIAVTLAKHLSNFEVHAIDVSVDALKVAQENAEANEVDITFMEADILDMEDSAVAYEVIVANPPYVRELEKKDMARNVTGHEPELALYVTDKNPLVFYDAIVRFAKKNLTKNGSLYLEINQYLAKETEQLLKNYNFSEIELRKDMFGNDRMMKGVYRYYQKLT
ncbi:MAG: peptide chain release factor N(5)-glutamine methyltransferase [Pricia sp.]